MNMTKEECDLIPRRDVVLTREPVPWDDNTRESMDGPMNRYGRENPEFEVYICACGSRCFEVIHTDFYETTARCPDCGEYWVVHSG